MKNPALSIISEDLEAVFICSFRFDFQYYEINCFIGTWSLL